MAFLARMMLSRPPSFERWERDRGHPILKDQILASDNPEWRAVAEKQELYLLPDGLSAGDAARLPGPGAVLGEQS